MNQQVSLDKEFGNLLRHWRQQKRVSQLDLGLQADVSARHISFIETGRSKPSRDMVLCLAEVLDVPLRERNTLLTAAGFAPVFRETGLQEQEMETVRSALDSFLAKMEPFPALVTDRSWNILMANGAALRVFSQFLADPGNQAMNVMDTVFNPAGMRPFVRNWEGLASYFLRRLEFEVADGLNPELDLVMQRIRSYPDVSTLSKLPQPSVNNAPVINLELEKDGLEMALFTTIATFGTAQDITLQELRLETFFPGNAETGALLEQWAKETH